MKRIFASILVLMLVLGLAGSAFAACQATTTASSLNVRVGAGSEFKVLRALPRNTGVYYLGVSDFDDAGNTWYKVQYGNYDTGWVSAKYCSLNEGYAVNSYVKAETGSTNIRSNPNLDGGRLGVLEKGQTATYLNQVCTDLRGVDWYLVSANGVSGWVSTMYTTLYTESLPLLGFMPTLGDYGATSATLKAEGGDVFIRGAANLNGKQLDVLKKGYTASYLNERSVDERGVVWFKVNYNGTVGWVSSRYGMLYGNVPATPVKDYILATGGDSNVRKTPSLDGAYMGILKKGESVPYLGESSTDNRGVIWYKVNFEGKTGWVSSMYAGLNGKTVSYGSALGSTVIATATTNVRREPVLDGKYIDNMVKDETAAFTGSTSVDERGVTWYKINFEGQIGWVSSKYTKLQ